KRQTGSDLKMSFCFIVIFRFKRKIPHHKFVVIASAFAECLRLLDICKQIPCFFKIFFLKSLGSYKDRAFPVMAPRKVSHKTDHHRGQLVNAGVDCPSQKEKRDDQYQRTNPGSHHQFWGLSVNLYPTPRME